MIPRSTAGECRLLSGVTVGSRLDGWCGPMRCGGSANARARGTGFTARFLIAGPGGAQGARQSENADIDARSGPVRRSNNSASRHSIARRCNRCPDPRDARSLVLAHITRIRGCDEIESRPGIGGDYKSIPDMTAKSG